MGAAFAGENRAVLLTGEQCFIGVRGFLGDLVTSLAGDLAGEHRRSCSWSVVMRLGLLVGNSFFVGVLTRDCLWGDLAGVRDLGAGLEGERKRWVEALEGVLLRAWDFTWALGEQRRSSSWSEVYCLGELGGNKDFAGEGTKDWREADLGGGRGVLGLIGLSNRSQID